MTREGLGRHPAVFIAVWGIVCAISVAEARLVTVNSEPPGGMVFINNSYCGVTPTSIELEHGQQAAVRITRTGCKPWLGRITPDIETLNAQLVSLDHALLGITSKPEGADVILNGMKAGTTPIILSKLEPDEYSVRLNLDGHLSEAFTVDLEAAEEHQIEVELQTLAELTLRRKIEEDPGDIMAHGQLAKHLLDSGDQAAAIAIMLDGLEAWDAFPHADPRRSNVNPFLWRLMGWSTDLSFSEFLQHFIDMDAPDTFLDELLMRLEDDPGKFPLYSALTNYYSSGHRDRLVGWFTERLNQPYTPYQRDILLYQFTRLLNGHVSSNIIHLQLLRNIAEKTPSLPVEAYAEVLIRCLDSDTRSTIEFLEQLMESLTEEQCNDLEVALVRNLRRLTSKEAREKLTETMHRLIDERPTDPRILMIIIDNLETREMRDASLRLDREHPEFVENHPHEFGRAFARLGDSRRAIELVPELYDRPVERHPPSPAISADDRNRIEALDDNKKELERIIEEMPDSPGAWLAFRALLDNSDVIDAAFYVERYKGRYRRLSNDLRHLAEIYRINLHEFELSMRTWTDYLELREQYRFSTHDLNVLNDMASTCFNGLNDHEQAVYYYERYFELERLSGNRPHVSSRVWAGESYRRLGDMENARRLWEEACRIQPFSYEALHARFLALRHLKEDIMQIGQLDGL